MLCLLARFPSETRVAFREEQVTDRWFFLPAHQVMYRLLVGEMDAGRHIDFAIVSTRARDLGVQETLGLWDAGEGRALSGHVAISRLWNSDALPSMLGYYLDELREKYVARELRNACEAVLKAIDEDWTQAGLPLVKAHLGSVQELASYGVRNSTVRHMKEFLPAAVEKVQQAFYSRGQTFGLPTGIPRMDRMTNGLRAGFTYYICGRPGASKSALMVHLLHHTCIGLPPEERAHGIAFSLEMTALQLTLRDLLKEAYIPLQRARDGMMSEARDFPKLMAAANALAQGNLYIDETSVVTMEDIASRTRRFVRKIRGTETDAQFAERKKKDRPDIVIAVDYIQRAKGSSDKQARYLELAELAQGLSALAKDLHIGVIVLCQLGRSETEGPFHFPKLSDLRESGDLEAEAHVVIAIHRPISYVKGNQDKMESAAEKLKIDVGDENELGARDLYHYCVLCVLKQREGPVGNIPVHFEPSLTRFEGWDRDEKLYSTNEQFRQKPASEEGE
jgi:replicative DNA helicase